MRNIRHAVWGVALALAVSTPAAATTGGEWVQAGYGPGQTYYNPGESVLNAASIGAVTERFAVELPEPVDGSCSRPAPPLVSGGRVFLADTSGIGAYSAATGKLLWQFTWDDPEDESTPYLAVSNGLLVAGNHGCQSASDPNGGVMALDVVTGAQRWALFLDPPVDSLVVDRGVVVVSGESTSDRPTVQAFDVLSGRSRWTLTGFTSPGVATGGRLLLTRTTANAAVAVNITTGKAIWTAPKKWYAEAATPATFFVNDARGTLTALNAATGKALWSVRDAAGRIATDGRRVYHPTGAMVEAFDVRTGKRVWWRSLTGKAGQPVRAGGLVYVAVGGRNAAVLNAANGAVMATRWSSGLAWTNRVTVAGGSIYTVAGNMLTAAG